MWPYQSVSREEFEKRKNFAELILRNLGCVVLADQLPYKQKTTTYDTNFEETWFSERPVYRYGNLYVRIDEVLFRDRPYIVLECAETIDEVMKNIMEDADPFPYDLPDAEIVKEIKCTLGIDPYPESDNLPAPHTGHRHQ